MFSPVAALPGAAPVFKASEASLSSAAIKNLRARIDGVGKMTTRALRLGGETVSQVIHDRHVACAGIDKRLKGVFALAQETVLVGDSGGRAAILGALPDADGTADEVETFVRSLIKKDAIDFGEKKKGAVASGGFSTVTHRIKTVGKRKMLVRFRYACRCR
jgi:hypothetical protein